MKMGWEERLKELEHQAQLKADKKMEKALKQVFGQDFMDGMPIRRFISNEINAQYIAMAVEAGCTQTKLAEALGISRRTISRNLKKMKNMG
ncbi:MAG: winged helix-turn-helix domain-containing protein [Thermoleophilia bacterium]